MLDQFDQHGVETLFLPVIKVAVDLILRGLNDQVPTGISDHKEGLSVLIDQEPAILRDFQRQSPLGCVGEANANNGCQDADENGHR
jgi:hypothetical protein